MKTTNVTVLTPLGSGVVQGRFERQGETGTAVRLLVRLPVNDVTRPRLRESLTPRASKSALFIFEKGELR
jgi:hypothetical protein